MVSAATAQEFAVTSSSFGTPGLIDMPTGFAFPDGQMINTTTVHGGTFRHTLSFQISPRLFASFRYSTIASYDGDQTRFDRSFDIGYQILTESRNRPALTIGMRDFAGTGIYGSEYLAASKHFLGGRLALTGGIGWGRLGSYNGFTNPLSIFSDRFKTRGAGPVDISEVGRLETDQWFTGDAAFFGGLSYQVTPRLTFLAEYSSDAYVAESARAGFVHNTPFNFGLSYQFKNGSSLLAYALHGSEFGISANLVTDPRRPRIPGGAEAAPPPIQPRGTTAALGWHNTADTTGRTRLSAALRTQGLTLDGFDLTQDTARIRIENNRYPAAAQAIGRAARVMANTLPETVEEFQIELARNGMPATRSTIRRADLETLEYDLDNSWRSFVRTRFDDAHGSDLAPDPDLYPIFNWSITPYLQPELFDPDNPVRADFGLQLAASVEPTRGLIFSGALRQPLWGNLDQSTRLSNSVLPHVRTDVVQYSKQSDLEIKHLTAEYFFRPGRNLFGRITAGYLETMYGGVSAEVLWHPTYGKLALGAELNYVKQRDFDQLFGFRDYEVLTGHASAYYDFGNGYHAQLDAGRYLAGDWGATVTLDRVFGNGFKVGAFFTLTDVPFSDFGEGSFDKGIHFSIPVDWLVGAPSQSGYSTTIRPVQRDGGARLEVRNRLYDLTRDMRVNGLKDRWGRFWR